MTDRPHRKIMLTYQFVKRLTTPFNEWPSYNTGVHDESGNLLVLEGQRTEQQEQSFNKFDLISLRLKKIMESIPGGNTRLASYAAAMMIINEKWEDKSESEKAVRYLNEQIAMTNLSEVKVAVSKLLQEETKKLALIEAKQFYVFEYIDPPAVMERKSEPQRALILLLSILLGGMLSVIYVLVKKYF